MLLPEMNPDCWLSTNKHMSDFNLFAISLMMIFYTRLSIVMGRQFHR